jgi:hypothetical protein
MLKKIAIVSALVLATGSAAFADEYLETTGSRSANVPAYSNVLPAKQAQQHMNRAEQVQFDRSSGIAGQ